MQTRKPPDGNDNVVHISSITARRREAESDFEPFFSHYERRQLRKLLALGPDAVARTIAAVDIVRVACPTMRRELDE